MVSTPALELDPGRLPTEEDCARGHLGWRCACPGPSGCHIPPGIAAQRGAHWPECTRPASLTAAVQRHPVPSYA